MHHLLVYLCSDPISEGGSDVCSSTNDEIDSCRGGLLVGAWAVGGTVSHDVRCALRIGYSLYFRTLFILRELHTQWEVLGRSSLQ